MKKIANDDRLRLELWTVEAWSCGGWSRGLVEYWSSCYLLLGELSEKKKGMKKKGINIYTIKY